MIYMPGDRVVIVFSDNYTCFGHPINVGHKATAVEFDTNLPPPYGEPPGHYNFVFDGIPGVCYFGVRQATKIFRKLTLTAVELLAEAT